MAASGDEVRRELDRLLASAVFANAGRMSRFLKFVVEKTLAGEGHRLKEYVIGVEVFDRDANYDPRVDAIVRVEAARLRAKLAEYYADAGRDDPVVLSLPKGGYAAVVRFRDAPPTAPTAPGPGVEAAAPAPRTPLRGLTLGALLAGAAAIAVVAWAPWSEPSEPALRVAVLPFTPDTDAADELAVAARLTEGVTAALVRDDRFAVVASSAARAAYTKPVRLRELAATLGADVVIEARVTLAGDRVRLEARGANGPLEQKFWVDSFAGDLADTDTLEREIAGSIAAALSAAATPN